MLFYCCFSRKKALKPSVHKLRKVTDKDILCLAWLVRKPGQFGGFPFERAGPCCNWGARFGFFFLKRKHGNMNHDKPLLVQPDKGGNQPDSQMCHRTHPHSSVIRVTSETIRKWKRISGTLNQRNDFKWLLRVAHRPVAAACLSWHFNCTSNLHSIWL